MSQVQIKTYKDTKEYEEDAKKMAEDGWVLKSSTQGKVDVGKTVAKALMGGGIGLAVMGRSRKGDTVTVTWEKEEQPAAAAVDTNPAVGVDQPADKAPEKILIAKGLTLITAKGPDNSPRSLYVQGDKLLIEGGLFVSKGFLNLAGLTATAESSIQTRSGASMGRTVMFGEAGALMRKTHVEAHSYLHLTGATGVQNVFETSRAQAIVVALQPHIAEARERAGLPPVSDGSPAAVAAAPAAPDITEQIKKLAELRDQGILTPEEFDAKKAELLARL